MGRVVAKSESTSVGAARRDLTSKFLLLARAKTFALKTATLCFECHSPVKVKSIQSLLVWSLVTFEANEMRPGFPDRARESRWSPRLMEILADICRARRHEKIARVQIKSECCAQGCAIQKTIRVDSNSPRVAVKARG